MLAATIAPPVGFMPATQSAGCGHRPPQELLPQRSGLLGGGTTVRVKTSARSGNLEAGEGQPWLVGTTTTGTHADLNCSILLPRQAGT